MKGRAIYAAQPNVVEVREIEIDEKSLKSDQVALKTRYSVISPGTELDCLSGRESGWFHIPAPLGYCAVSEVLAVGDGVTEYAPGDLVLSANVHASVSIMDTGWGLRGKVPANADPRVAPLVHMAQISITALRQSTAELGDHAVVLGQGIVGNLAAQCFARQGCRVIGVDRVAARLEISRKCGIEMTINGAETDAVAVVKELTDGRGAEVIVDATGTAPAVLQGLDMAARSGEMILLGTPRGEYQADIVPLMRAVHRNNPNLTLKGAHGGSIRMQPDPYVKHSLVRNARIIFDLLARGELHLKPLVTRVAKPEEAADVYRAQREHPEAQLGVIFDWTA